MTFEILSTPVNSPASLIFQQCLAEVDPENRSLNSAMNEVGGYFLDRAATSPMSKELWNKVLDKTNNEKSHGEIAEITKIPLGTVKSRIRLALEKIRGKLEQDGTMVNLNNDSGSMVN